MTGADDADPRASTGIVRRVRVPVPHGALVVMGTPLAGIAIDVVGVWMRSLHSPIVARTGATVRGGCPSGDPAQSTCVPGVYSKGNDITPTRGGHTRQEPTGPRSRASGGPTSMNQPRGTRPDPFSARSTLRVGGREVTVYRLENAGMPDLDATPMTVKILLENVLRNAGREAVTEQDIRTLATWRPGEPAEAEVPFLPARVLLQDFTGVPAVVDLAAMRDAMASLGGDPSRINPLVPADLVIDHSVQVDQFRGPGAFAFNVGREYERNSERYQLLRWAQTAFADFSVVPPGTGIVHQVNLEYLAKVVVLRDIDGLPTAFPDTLVGTDSHTTMVNGLGVLGYGVGGIEAEAVLLGQPLYQPMPRVVGVRLHGELPRGSTATDLVLVISQMLRKHGVVGAFVEFAGDGLDSLALADRATISNMSPEYGATAALFPIDAETLTYLRLTGRASEQIDLVEAYAKEVGLWRWPGPGPRFDETLELDLATVEPSVAGPRRPQDRVPLGELRENFRTAFPTDIHEGAESPLAIDAPEREAIAHEAAVTSVEEAAVESFPASDPPSFAQSEEKIEPASEPEPELEPTRGLDSASFYRAVPVEVDGQRAVLRTGSVVIAAITSCTNTSNPTVMVGAGLLARNAIRRGLSVSPTVKTSLAPGSRAVTEYLGKAGLMEPLEQLGFGLVGYGCTTCIGNSGPLEEPIAKAVEEHDLIVAAVLSGNRNFEGRIHPLARASYLASPPLVVAFALAGRVDIDLTTQPLGRDRSGTPVFLEEIWPSAEEIKSAIADALDPELFRSIYSSVFEGDERWRALPVPLGDRYDWDESSTYVANPPFFVGLTAEPAPVSDIVGARALAVLGDSVTTDHISPAGSIPAWSPAGQWLQEHGVSPLEFNSYGARRGHHEVMMRGTFGSIRLKNALASKEGPWTTHQPDGEEMFIYDAAMRYEQEGVPLVLLAGREYGSGSSRDWAAKGTLLLGVRAVIAESYERIHRSNLVGMGVLPLQFREGENATSLGLTGRERFDILGLSDGLDSRELVTVRATADDGTDRTFRAISRLDGPIEVNYYRQGGILPAVLRRLAQA
jgi:aconitate hydratase